MLALKLQEHESRSAIISRVDGIARDLRDNFSSGHQYGAVALEGRHFEALKELVEKGVVEKFARRKGVSLKKLRGNRL